MHVVGQQVAGSKEARLTYRTVQPLPRATLLEIQLETGRKHQIRVQLAACGHPILGDRKYGATRSFADGIALHARRLVFEHPVRRGMRLELSAPLPASWKSFNIPE
jgi:23S rRNA-/tRNA-specific pseudouridylate synthase